MASLLPNNRSKSIVVKRVFQTNPIKGDNYLSLGSVMRTDSNKITINATPRTCLVNISFFFSFFFFVVNDPFEDSSRRLFSFQRPNDAPRYVFTLTSENISWPRLRKGEKENYESTGGRLIFLGRYLKVERSSFPPRVSGQGLSSDPVTCFTLCGEKTHACNAYLVSFFSKETWT